MYASYTVATGALIAVNGNNFGQTDLTPTISIGLTICTTVSWSTASSLTCLSPTGKGPAQAVALTITGQVGTGAAAFTYDAPVVTQNNWQNSAVTGQATVIVEGTNFGPAVINEVNQLSVFLGETKCRTVAWLSSSCVSCITNSGTGAKLPVQVAVAGIIGTRNEGFSYDSAVITRSSPANAPASGRATLTITGTNFGSQDTTLTARVGNQGTACTTSSWTSNTRVDCITAAGTSDRQEITLEVSQLIGSAHSYFSFDSPVVTSSTPNAPTDWLGGPASVTVAGANFGVGSLSDSERVVRFGGTACSTYAWNSDTSVTCSSVIGWGLKISPTVEVSGSRNIGTLFQAFTFDAPVICDMKMPNAATSAGTTVTVLGKNFLITDHSPTIRVGLSLCMTSSWTTATALQCGTPLGAGKDYKASVTIEDLIGSQLMIFTFNAPVVTATFRPNGPTSSGAVVTIVGSNFGPSDTQPQAQIGQTKCKQTTWTSTTTITCLTPPGINSPNTQTVVGVFVQGQAGLRTGFFTFDAPVVTDVRTFNGPTRAGVGIIVNGFNFAESGDINTLPLPAILVGQATCLTDWISATALACKKTPSGTGVAVNIGALVGSIAGTISAAFTYDQPIVTGAPARLAPARPR
jgi:hypothetical protein